MLNIKELRIDSSKVKHSKQEEAWSPPTLDGLKFIIDRSTRNKLGQDGIRGVLREAKGKVLCIFSLSIGIHEKAEWWSNSSNKMDMGDI
ncbi:hypothetical protein QYF36_009910 [Acer negundo]|nr:hypothetical protein QYF36_009910 [Acer negundo]